MNFMTRNKKLYEVLILNDKKYYKWVYFWKYPFQWFLTVDIFLFENSFTLKHSFLYIHSLLPCEEQSSQVSGD